MGMAVSPVPVVVVAMFFIMVACHGRDSTAPFLNRVRGRGAFRK